MPFKCMWKSKSCFVAKILSSMSFPSVVFDSCFTTDVFNDDKYQDYIGDIVAQLQCHFADASFMVFNFREGESQSLLANILSSYEMVVMDYPRQYEGCPLVTIEIIHHFLRSGESWLSLSQQNVLIMHCERGGWAVLAFMLAGLLLYRKQYIGEQRTLEMIYRQAPRELIQLLSPLNPMPSQIRYLHYISRRNVSAVWPPGDRALTLDCVILRNIPGFNGEGGCRPIFRIYGKDPLLATSNTPKVLFSTPKRSKYVRLYKKVGCKLLELLSDFRTGRLIGQIVSSVSHATFPLNHVEEEIYIFAWRRSFSNSYHHHISFLSCYSGRLRIN